MKVRGVKFGDYHTSMWGLILNAKTIEPPEPKEVMISVDGRDGNLDVSEALTGDIKYNNRTLSFTFICVDGTYKEREKIKNILYAKIHGRRLNVILDDDTSKHFKGRCKIKSWSNDKAYATVEIEVNADPWYYNNQPKIFSYELNNAVVEIPLTNRGIKKVIPLITVDGNVSINYNGSFQALANGIYRLTDLILENGTKIISANGKGSLIIKYEEATF